MKFIESTSLRSTLQGGRVPVSTGALPRRGLDNDLAIIYTQRWKNAEDRSYAEHLANKHLIDVITRHVEKEGK